MRSHHSGATSAPPISLQFLRMARISARVGVSPAVAGVLAGLAFGAGRRDDCAAVWAVTTDRTAAAGAVRQ